MKKEKKVKTLRDLSDVLHARQIAARPNMPAYAVPKKSFSDKNANSLTTAIVAYLQDYKGYLAYRQSTEGRYRPGKTFINVIGKAFTTKGKFIPALKKGLADVTAVLKGGKYVGIEVKIGRDRQRDDQKKFEKQLTKSGGVYMIVTNWDDFLKQIKPYV